MDHYQRYPIIGNRQIGQLLCIVVMLCIPAGMSGAQEFTPPTWSVGDWWIVNSQVYDAGKIVPGAEPRWLPPQVWHFQVEGQELLENQNYFLVAIRPGDGNPSPYWYRFWFRQSDRYVGRYELHHPESSGSKRTRNLDAPSVGKNFDPALRLPFLTSKLPALPLTLPVFAEVRQSTPRGVRGNSTRSIPAHYIGPEFELSQEIQPVDASTFTAKTPDDVELLSTSPENQHVLVTIRTSAAMLEEQYWNPQYPWCLYGQRLENSVVTRRYWLVETGSH